MENKHNDKMISRKPDEIDSIIKRLRRVEGQVRGVQKMVEEDRYCIDILTQVLAIEAAIKKVGFSIIERHTNKCVIKAIKNENEEEFVNEIMQVICRYVK